MNTMGGNVQMSSNSIHGPRYGHKSGGALYINWYCESEEEESAATRTPTPPSRKEIFFFFFSFTRSGTNGLLTSFLEGGFGC